MRFTTEKPTTTYKWAIRDADDLELISKYPGSKGLLLAYTPDVIEISVTPDGMVKVDLRCRWITNAGKPARVPTHLSFHAGDDLAYSLDDLPDWAKERVDAVLEERAAHAH